MDKIPKQILDEYLSFLQQSYFSPKTNKNLPALLEKKLWKSTNFLAKTNFFLDIPEWAERQRPSQCFNPLEPSIHLNVTHFTQCCSF